MAITIPSERGEPIIKIFESLEELKAETGQSACHGFFDAKANTILATADSVAHEVGHFLDFKSGGLKDPSKEKDPQKKAAVALRNEIVAVVFAFAKCGEGGTSLNYEIRFMEWLHYSRKSGDFGPHPQKNLSEFSFSEIQALANWLVQIEHAWFDRLSHFFRTYLLDEQSVSTYGRNFLRLK